MSHYADPLVQADLEYRQALARLDSELGQVLEMVIGGPGLTEIETDAAVGAAPTCIT